MYLEKPGPADSSAPLLYTSPAGGNDGSANGSAHSGGGIPAAASSSSVNSLTSCNGGSNSDGVGALAGTPILAAYPSLEALQQKRLAARRHKTTFCYDFPSVFGNALRQAWAERAAAGEPDSAPPPGDCLAAIGTLSVLRVPCSKMTSHILLDDSCHCSSLPPFGEVTW